jgi:ketosteroid isomerase-like protein
MERTAVVRSAWDAYAAGDVDGALRFFSPDAVWHVPPDYPGPTSFRGHDELRTLLDTARFSVHRMEVTDISDMGGFVLAHGVVYAEADGTPVIDRVTIWRCRVEGDTITRVDAEVVPTGGRLRGGVAAGYPSPKRAGAPTTASPFDR